MSLYLFAFMVKGRSPREEEDDQEIQEDGDE
jgi:hypothetical protein